MRQKLTNTIFILIIVVLCWLISFAFNDWFCATMPRHQLLQLPAMLFLGFFTGWQFLKKLKLEMHWGISLLIFVMASLIFWMLPHSIDAAVIDNRFNLLMLINMFVAGLLTFPVLRNIIFEIRILFLGMVAVMIIATGIALISFNLLLCSAFNIEQQKETGAVLIKAGIAFFFFTLYVFFRGIGKHRSYE